MFNYKYIFLLACVISDTKCNSTLTCGIENTDITNVTEEGAVNINRYPWMGLLFYPVDKKRYTTLVILVTRQMVLASAIEIDKFPKENFRSKTKVIIGHRCGEQEEIGVRDYTYHPDYSRNTYSTLALVQLEADNVRELHPICPPPDFLTESSIFAMTITGECIKAEVQTYEMQYVDSEQCKTFYRRSGLDVSSFWPSHTTCARSLSEGSCVWRSGTALVVKQEGHWRLLGVGIYGPGCEDPARFLDYGMYHQWTLQSVRRVGYPTVTRLADNHIVLRKKMSSVQRYGPCDVEEKEKLIYREDTTIKSLHHGRAFYNLTLRFRYDYKCLTIKAQYTPHPGEQRSSITLSHSIKDSNTDDRFMGKPKLYLRRWCVASSTKCSNLPLLEINFYVEVLFSYMTSLNVECYGKERRMLDPHAVYKYINVDMEAKRPPILKYEHELKKMIEIKDSLHTFNWFYSDDSDVEKDDDYDDDDDDR